MVTKLKTRKWINLTIKMMILFQLGSSTHYIVNVPYPVIRYLRETNITQCANGTFRNTSTIRDDAITFNFYNAKENNKMQVFQVPRCLFTSKLAEELMDKVDLFESFESYKRKLDVYATVPTDIPYLHYNHILVKEAPTTTSDSSYNVNISDFRSLDTSSCTLFEKHDVIFTIHTSCAEQTLSDQHSEINITFTSSFILTKMKLHNHSLILLFGDLNNITFKAPFEKDNFIFRQTQQHDVIILIRKDAMATYPFLKKTDFPSVLKTNYENVSEIFKVFNQQAVNNLMENTCTGIHEKTIDLLFTYTTLVFSTIRNTHRDLRTTIEELTGIMEATNYIFTCIPHQKSSQHLMYNASSTYHTLLNNDHWLRSNVDVNTHLIYVAIKQDATSSITEKAMNTLTESSLKIHKKNIASFISRHDRRELGLMAFIIHSTSSYNKQRRQIFATLTGLCSMPEANHWSNIVTKGADLGLADLYTPCSGGGRRDHTLERIAKLFPAMTPKSTSTQTLFRVLTFFRPSINRFPEISCLNTEDTFTTVTLPRHTFLFTNEHTIAGTSFPVTSTIVGVNIIITVIPSNATCQRSNQMHTTLPIVMAKNITLTSECNFCESALIEYHDEAGLVNLMYLHDTEDLKFTLDDKNKIFVNYPRTHYIMALRNGTVIEVTDVVLDIKDTSLLVLTLYTTAALFGLFLLYRIFRLC
ncbi:envelope glycoprotein H [Saimiriine betaherpesvirus 4]|uniref:Envelope glycoprotein H n=1 Tax=Saimiriine betaherpesvirus 4 TaxID=1535247 RepID=G8XSY0_9BETA|nr:envelope glycoprotein H [Saimiriine betaherpesvirus 4]AEV80926.1 envelope glycoprotein H [Saimiriine betaherpesvirus 4]